MGCDIHGPYLEQRYGRADIPGAQRWDCVAEFHMGRDYTLFGILAGVREPSSRSFAPKGPPDSPSWFVGAELREIGPDEHSASWLTTDEVAAACDAYVAQTNGEYEPHRLRLILAAMRAAESPENPCRIVFWFDN